MIRYEVAERIARVICNQGWNDLLPSEEAAYQHDSELKNLVDSILSGMNSKKIVKECAIANYSLGNDDPRLEILVSWEFGDMAREARLWKHEYSDMAVLEVKEWSRDDFNRDCPVGSHEMIFKKSIKFNNTDELLDRCKGILAEYNCPEEEISKIQIE